MAQSSEFAHYIAELLAPTGPVRVRRMFGGHGFYCDGFFVAILSGETLYLKADAQSRAEFELAGCQPFTYQRNGKTATLNFYSAPVDALESSALLLPWARLALQAALRANAASPRSPDGNALPAQSKPARPVRKSARKLQGASRKRRA